MILYLSGGSEIAESGLKDPAIMLSFFVVVNKKNKPNSRCRSVMRLRRKAKKKGSNK